MPECNLCQLTDCFLRKKSASESILPLRSTYRLPLKWLRLNARTVRVLESDLEEFLKTKGSKFHVNFSPPTIQRQAGRRIVEHLHSPSCKIASRLGHRSRSCKTLHRMQPASSHQANNQSLALVAAIPRQRLIKDQGRDLRTKQGHGAPRLRDYHLFSSQTHRTTTNSNHR